MRLRQRRLLVHLGASCTASRGQEVALEAYLENLILKRTLLASTPPLRRRLVRPSRRWGRILTKCGFACWAPESRTPISPTSACAPPCRSLVSEVLGAACLFAAWSVDLLTTVFCGWWRSSSANSLLSSHLAEENLPSPPFLASQLPTTPRCTPVLESQYLPAPCQSPPEPNLNPYLIHRTLFPHTEVTKWN